MERMREDPAPPAWRAESSSATAGDGSHRAERSPGRSPGEEEKTGLIREFENFHGDAEDTRSCVFASEVADRKLCPFLRRVFTHEKINLR